MGKQIRMYAGVGAGLMFFDGSRVPPAPLGGIVVASLNPNFTQRLRIVRTDQFNKDGVTERRLFKRIPVTNIRNKANERLVADLGFTVQQVIDYINDQANKKSNEIDIQKAGALVGGGTTLNFTGGIDNVAVSGDIATIKLDQVGIRTSGSYVGTGITLFDFRGSGVSTVTAPSAGISTIFVEGGALNTSDLIGTINVNTQLSASLISYGGVTLGLGDVDATPAFNLVDATGYKYSNLVDIPTHSTTINEFEWYQQYLSPGVGFSTAGPGITTTNPPTANNPYYYGVQLKPYQQVEWDHVAEDTGSLFVGKWGGSTTYTPSDAGHQSLWERMLRIRRSLGNGHHVSFENTVYDSVGFAHTGHASNRYMALSAGDHLILRYDGADNKLKLINQDDSNHVVGTASTAENGSPITISFAITDNIHVPSISTVTYYEPQTNYKLYNSEQYLENSTHDKDDGVAYHVTPITRGEEILFTVGGAPINVGVWNGGKGVVGITTVHDKTKWTTKWFYSSADTRWSDANTAYKQVGTDLSTDVEVNSGTYSIRYDYETEKLQLHQINSAYDWHISNASAGVNTTSQLIFFSSGNDVEGDTSALPSVSTVRPQDFTIVSKTTATEGATLWHGSHNNDVWKSNRALTPGLKVKFTIPTNSNNQYWAVGYEGTTTQTNPYQQGTATWRLNNTEKLSAHENCTENTKWTAHDGTNSLAVPGRNMSWRYNADNSWDIYDEDTDEVVITSDSNLDGNEMYPYGMPIANDTSTLSAMVRFTWEWNNPTWFLDHRDWTPGHSSTSYVGKIANVLPMKTTQQAIPTSSGGYDYIGNASYRVTWGQKMRPGQEFSWTQLSDNSNGATKHNMIIGVLNSNYNAFDYGVRFRQGGELKIQSDQDSGFTVQSGITTTTAGQSCRLKYDAGDNKLKMDVVRAGVRETIAISTSALDGNPIYISLGGESTRLPSVQGISVYGWECVHQGVNHYNPWNNWRIGGFPENQTSIGVGTHVSGNPLAYKVDQVWRHKDGIPSGYKMHWLTPASATNSRFGQWKTGNATSGLTNVESTTTYWDWGWRTNTSESLFEPVGMTLNTSNSNYNGSGTPLWADPNPGSTKISIRYHSNNSLDVFDESNSEVIMTKDANCDGNPVYISWGADSETTTAAQMQDDFFGGGDVGIALTSASV